MTGSDPRGRNQQHEIRGDDLRRDRHAGGSDDDGEAQDDGDVVHARPQQVVDRQVAFASERRDERGHQLGRGRSDRDDGQADDRLADAERVGDLGATDQELGSDEDGGDADHELNDESNEGGPAFGRPSHVARADGVRVSSARVEDAARVDDAPQQQEDAVRRAEDAVARQRVEDQRGDHHRRQVEPQRPPLEATGTSRAARPAAG